MTCLPLDQQEISITRENGQAEVVSALDRCFMLEINFLQYNAFPIHEKSDSPILREWLDEIKILCYDLETLLSLSHRGFWVQLIHDSTLHSMLSTYLQKAPRSWDIWSIPENFLAIHKKLNKLIFLTLLRMSTDKESKDQFLTPDAFGFTVYENYMFDIPKIIDICSLYGHPYGGNGVLVNKMLTNIFTKQESYVDDLKVVAQQLHHNVLASVITKYDGALTTIGLYDLLCFYYDTCMSLICLFSTYPPTGNYFDASELISSFASIYSHLFHDIKTKLKKMSTPAQDLQSLKSIINRGQLATVRLLHCVIWHSCLMDQLLDDTLTADEHTRCAEQFIANFSLILGDVQLMTKYYHECNLAKTFALIKNSKAEVGQDHFDYILNAIEVEKSPERDSRDLDKVHYEGTNHSPRITEKNNFNGCESQSKGEPENIEFLLTNIKNIFPQFSDSFLRECLAAYSFSSEEVISALLENNLPPHLESLKSQTDKQIQYDQQPCSSKDSFIDATERNNSTEQVDFSSKNLTSATESYADKVSSILSTRQNIFDNDEFDVFNNPHELNFDRIHIGKKSRENVSEGITTKSFLNSNPKFNFEYDEYEDEYDDTYDGLVAATDSNLTDEPSEFVIKPLNAPLPVEEEKEEDDDKEQNGSTSSDQQTSQRTNAPQISNRDSIRARGRGRNNQGSSRVEDKKGQKADSKVLQQRRRDNENKSSRGNHNRKRGADKKRRGGMIHM
ncbi:hypothetical protein ACHWQZ_G012728 [Mnemiopsis leidyi]